MVTSSSSSHPKRYSGLIIEMLHSYYMFFFSFFLFAILLFCLFCRALQCNVDGTAHWADYIAIIYVLLFFLLPFCNSFCLFCSATWMAQPIGQIPQSPELPPHPENGKLNIYLRSENFYRYFFAQFFKTLLVCYSIW